MPELPEVETSARGLANAIVGKTISVAVSVAKIAVAPAGRASLIATSLRPPPPRSRGSRRC